MPNLIQQTLIAELHFCPPTFSTGGSLRDAAYHAPDALLLVRLVAPPVQRDALLLHQYHVHRLQQPSLQIDHVALRDGPDEVGHAGVRIVNRTEPGQDGHYGDADYADA